MLLVAGDKKRIYAAVVRRNVVLRFLGVLFPPDAALSRRSAPLCGHLAYPADVLSCFGKHRADSPLARTGMAYEKGLRDVGELLPSVSGGTYVHARVSSAAR